MPDYNLRVMTYWLVVIGLDMVALCQVLAQLAGLPAAELRPICGCRTQCPRRRK